jgi:molybdopterin-synthase adenylyltransferase
MKPWSRSRKTHPAKEAIDRMEEERYQRHSLIDWFSQEDVHKYRIAIIGCGAIGNEVIKNLVLLGAGSLDLYDLDQIEIHNLTRSVLFRECDVGKSKAEVAADRARELDPNVVIRAFTGDFWETLNLIDLKTYDAVFCCVDNFEARIRLNTLCQIASVNLINSGIDSKNAMVEVFPYSTSLFSACYECNLPLSVYARVQQRYSCGWLKKQAFIEKKIPTTILTSSIAGALAVANGLNVLRQDEPSQAFRIFVDTFSGQSTKSELVRKEGCASCTIREKEIRIASVRNSLTENLFLKSNTNFDCHIMTSDPILVSYFCRLCDPHREYEELVLERASDHDSSITKCPRCFEDAIVVDIRDMFSYQELTKLFQERALPVKYVYLETDSENMFFQLE